MKITPPTQQEQKEHVNLPDCIFITDPTAKTIKDAVQGAATCLRVLASSLQLYTFADAKEYALQYIFQLKAVYNYLAANQAQATPIMLADMLQAISLIIAARAGSSAAPGNFTQYFQADVIANALDLQHKIKDLNRKVFDSQYSVH